MSGENDGNNDGNNVSNDRAYGRHPGRQLLLCVAAVLCNLLLNRLVGELGLPLFLDNIGTLLAAILGGYLPGIAVGYLTNLVNMTADVTNAYYAVLSTMIAAVGAYLADHGFFRKWWKALLTVPIFALIGGALGSVLTYLMYGFGIGDGISAPFAQRLLAQGQLSVFWAQMMSDLAIDLVDKAITVAIVYVALRLLPERWKSSLRLEGWRQTPLNEAEQAATKKHSTRSMSLRSKVIWLIGTVMVFIALVTTTVSYLLYRSFAIEQYTSVGVSIARLVASTIDGDQVEAYLAQGEQALGYLETKERLTRIRESSPDIEYLYVYQIREDGCYVVFDLDTDTLAGEAPGTYIPFDESFMEDVPILLAGGYIDPIITNDTYGWLLTDYEPVYDSAGRCVCYAAADIQMQDVTVNSISFLVKTGSLFVGFFILILCACIWFANYSLIYPITAMTLSARRFAYDTEAARDDSVEQLRSLGIRTGDEIENLYDALSRTIAETVGYIDEVREKGDALAKMQNGLIYVLADLVESRDKNTGDHVRKTAAYVRMMLRRMREEGIYAEQLTDEYVQDVANSAPLHDVGKIKVSDTILNKPGKLDDDEFSQMKAHTTEGGQIIEGAISLVSDSGYLKEAKNLAMYHHEKWDGSGYPCGLAGEEIPLSARIMAIADVFDALVSKRSYKKAFSIEQALDIIREGKGKHFDPELAQLFLDSEDEVRRIAAEQAS